MRVLTLRCSQTQSMYVDDFELIPQHGCSLEAFAHMLYVPKSRANTDGVAIHVQQDRVVTA